MRRIRAASSSVKPCLKSVSTSRGRVGQLPGASSTASHSAVGALAASHWRASRSRRPYSSLGLRGKMVGVTSITRGRMSSEKRATSLGSENSVRQSDEITTRVSG